MTNFKLTGKDIEKIKEFEGVRLTAYKAVPTEKYYTIGAGHYGRDVSKGMTITEQQAKELLAKDLVAFEAGVNELGVCKSQDEYVALVDFAYNCGMSALRKSTLLSYIKQGKTQLMIIRQFMAWTKSGGRVLNGLVKRRQWEAERFVGKPIYKSADDGKWYIRKS